MQLINPEVRIENTNLCNAKCTICPREKMTRPLATMPQEHFEDIVDQAKDLGAETISVFGYGEPLIDPQVTEKVRYCTDHGLDTFITTNGSLLTLDKAKPLLEAGLKHIRFSVHGLFNEDYEKVHGGLSFLETIRNISNFRALNTFRNGNCCKVSVSVIPTVGEDIEAIKQAWQRIDYLEIWKPHNWTDGRSYRKLEKKKKTCGRAANGPIQINADGKVMVCCFDYDAKLTVGDTYKDSLEQIIKGKAYNRIRDKHLSGDLSGLVCEYCDQLNEGDEPLLYSSRDPECKTNTTSSTKFNINP